MPHCVYCWKRSLGADVPLNSVLFSELRTLIAQGLPSNRRDSGYIPTRGIDPHSTIDIHSEIAILC
jgi:hypothetical protein